MFGLLVGFNADFQQYFLFTAAAGWVAICSKPVFVDKWLLPNVWHSAGWRYHLETNRVYVTLETAVTEKARGYKADEPNLTAIREMSIFAPKVLHHLN